jgi:hypothetical protein
MRSIIDSTVCFLASHAGPYYSMSDFSSSQRCCRNFDISSNQCSMIVLASPKIRVETRSASFALSTRMITETESDGELYPI